MQIHLIAVGTRMPGWVSEGYKEYARRMPKECGLRLVEIPLGSRSGAANVKRAMEQEGKRMLAAVPRQSVVVALEEAGSMWNTQDLARHLESWRHTSRNLCLLVGGPDGLSDSCRSRAEYCWSLSRLTLPHMVVRIVVAEQFYRAWTVLVGHPYHRG